MASNVNNLNIFNNNYNYDIETNRKLSTRKNLIDLNSSKQENREVFENHELLLGKDFINSYFLPVNCSDIFKTPVICLFFYAQFCNPSQHFIKDLIELYNETNQGVVNLEIIQIPVEKDKCLFEVDDKEKQDRIKEETINSYKQFLADKPEKPWMFIPCLDERAGILKAKYNIKINL